MFQRYGQRRGVGSKARAWNLEIRKSANPNPSDLPRTNEFGKLGILDD